MGGRLCRMKLGEWGEHIAEKELQKKGYMILEKNYRCRMGEIDIIVEKANVIVFVEVKTRVTRAYGLPCQSITEKKKAHIRRVAQFYMLERAFGVAEMRIDVVELLKIEGKWFVHHIEGAF